MPSHRDITIVGGGMVGISLALLLSARLSSENNILLIEGFPVPERDEEYGSTYSPSFDARSTALSYSSYEIYSGQGLWPELARRACPIEAIHVSERGRFGSTLMKAADYGWDALGYVVENAWLGTALVQALRAQQRVDIQSPARVVAARPTENGYQLELDDGMQLTTGLLLVADGAESSLREALGVEADRRQYGNWAVIANVAHAKPHAQVAYERFTDEGPMAMLPLLPDGEGRSRSALVWTLPESDAKAMIAASDSEFLEILQTRYGYRLGRLEAVGERASYPLSLVQAKEQVRPGLVILGNAAHSLHPVAGQGFNLALRDVSALSDVLAQAERDGLAGSDLSVLETYLQRQQTDQEHTVGFSDHLPGLFTETDPALKTLRDMGLFALDLAPGLKKEFVMRTAGVSALRRGQHG